MPRAAPVMITALALFSVLAIDLMAGGPVTRADVPISLWFHQHAHPLFTHIMQLVSGVHSTRVICLMALAAGLLLAWRRRYDWLPPLALAVPGGLILNVLVKHLFQRPRPVFDAAPAVTTYSFPSGHTAGATVWWGFLLVLWFAFEKRPLPRAAGAAIALFLVLLTALSRVYLGAHYPSDVFAAMAEGIAWLAIALPAAAAWKPAFPIERRIP